MPPKHDVLWYLAVAYACAVEFGELPGHGRDAPAVLSNASGATS